MRQGSRRMVRSGPAETRSGHVEPPTLRKQHASAFKVIAKDAAKQELKPVVPFVLYSLRYTFLTCLGESGCDAWTLARIAGHANIAVSAHYIHASDHAAFTAVEGGRGGRASQWSSRTKAATMTRSLSRSPFCCRSFRHSGDRTGIDAS